MNNLQTYGFYCQLDQKMGIKITNSTKFYMDFLAITFSHNF